MALIHWKQIDGDLSGSRVLTGSLVVSGSVTADSFVGIDPTAIFKSDGTNTVSASVNPDGTIFSVTRDGTDTVSYTHLTLPTKRIV